MPKGNVNENLRVEVGLQVTARTAGTVNGTGVDCLGADECLVVAMYGTFTATSTCDIKIQESADNSTFTDITGAVFPQVIDSTDETTKRGRIWLHGRKRYLRAVIVTAVAAGDAGVLFILAEHRNTPVTQPVAFTFDVIA